MSVLMEVIGTWMCWISYRGRYVGILVLHLLLLLNPWLSVSVYPVSILSIGFTSVDVPSVLVKLVPVP